MPRAPLSVIIPTLNTTASSLLATTHSLMPAVRDGLIRELIISDGGSAGMAEIATEIGAKFVVGEASRGQQLHQGAMVAQGDWLMFLHSDTQLANQWSEIVCRHIQTSDAAAYFRLKFSASGFGPLWVAAWANCRARWFDLPYGDQGLLISKKFYHQMGGYQAIPIMEDVAMARQLKGRLEMLDCEAITDPIRYLEDGWFNRGRRNLFLLLRFLSGASPQSLASDYQGRNTSQQTAEPPP